MHEPTVAVVMTVRNGERYIDEAIQSVRDQTLDAWQLVIVDDASSDATHEIAWAAQEQDERVRVVRNERAIGAYAAAHIGIEESTGEYIARLDADDVCEADRLRLQVNALRESPYKSACTGAWRLIRPDGTLDPAVRRVPSRSNGVLRWSLIVQSGLVHSSLCIRRVAYESLGGYGPRKVAEDYRLWARLICDDGLLVLDDPVVRWRAHPAQVTAQPDSRRDPERLEARSEHIRACTGETWAHSDIHDLWAVGGRADFGLSRSSELLARWENRWKADRTLDAEERAELRRLAADIRARHLRNNWAAEPGLAVTEAFNHAPEVGGALVRYMIGRRRWG